MQLSTAFYKVFSLFCCNLSGGIALIAVAARGEIGREGCEMSSLAEHMGLSPWLFL